MMYFDKLIGRLSGGGFGQMLSPVMSLWSDLYDPFENTSVLPLSYPDTVKKQNYSIDGYSALSRPGRPVAGKPDFLQKKGLQALDRGRQQASLAVRKSNSKFARSQTDELRPKHSARAGMAQRLKKQAHTVLQDVITPSHSYDESFSLPQRNNQDHSPVQVRTKDKTIQAEQVVPVNTNNPESSPVNSEPLRVWTHSARTEIIEQATANITPLPVKSLDKLSRKRKKLTPEELIPKLLIGQMNVAVVPVQEPLNTLRPATVATPVTNAAAPDENSAQVQKMSFGLGQM